MSAVQIVQIIVCAVIAAVWGIRFCIEKDEHQARLYFALSQLWVCGAVVIGAMGS